MMIMHLLALNNGITRAWDDMEALVVQAGFQVTSVTHMQAVVSVIKIILE
jgi:hypothetical protein